jgi:CRP-like cAMP-binding protein
MPSGTSVTDDGAVTPPASSPQPFDPAELRLVPLFQGCSDEDVARLARVVCRLRLPAGSVLATQGEPATALVLLIEGTAEVRRDGQLIGQLGPGDHAGARSLLVPQPCPSSVVAMGEVVVNRVGADEFRRLVTTTPALAWPLLESLTGLSADNAAWR